jgi:hypothetical protein
MRMNRVRWQAPLKKQYREQPETARTGVHTAKFRPDQAALPEKPAD